MRQFVGNPNDVLSPRNQADDLLTRLPSPTLVPSSADRLSVLLAAVIESVDALHAEVGKQLVSQGIVYPSVADQVTTTITVSNSGSTTNIALPGERCHLTIEKGGTFG